MPETPADLLTRFTAPAPEYGPLPLWWWSGARVTRERLRAQMRTMLAQGVHQAVVICLAPTGPMFGALADDPPYLGPAWLDLLAGACADADELGFTLWMYDQIGFSGANLQGRLIADHPEYGGLALHRTRRPPDAARTDLRAPAGHTALAAYARLADGSVHPADLDAGTVRWHGPPATLTLVHSGPSGFDLFGADACAALLDQVHGTLERAVGQWFGRSIGGFFQDELPALPTWGRDFAATFAQRYGYELPPRLAALWEPDTGDEAARVRRDYHEHRARLGRRAFFDPQRAYFERHGLVCGFDQPSPAREGDPAGGVRLYGDYLATHAGYGAPGSDHWGDAKVHSSLAHAHGHPRTWIEAFHSSGWGGTLEETYDWLAPFLRRGATLYNPHAVYYATPGGWWEWAPPSTCWRQPYWPSYHLLATAVARLCSVLTAGRHDCDTVLLTPTTAAQAHLTLDGALPPAAEASGRYHELNGVGCWFAEERGVLERAGLDHDTLDEATVAAAETTPEATLRIGAETYRTVVLPGPEALSADAARTLAGFAAAGGRVVCAGAAPRLFLGPHGPDSAAAALFHAAVERGDITVTATADVPAAVATAPGRITADVPFLLRRHGALGVVALTAHDERTGTRAPVVKLPARGWYTPDAAFTWAEYWRQLRDHGPELIPAAGRTATLRVHTARRPRAQRWDPGTSDRTALTATPHPEGGWRLDVPFEDGPVALVVLGDGLPAPTRTAPGPVTATVPLDGPWRLRARSTLDNTHGDLAAPDRTGVLPVEVWRMAHRAAPEGPWRPVTAGFGPFALAREGDGDFAPVEWSLSRGIHDDPVHEDRLGPKGYVPEEFLDWRHLTAGSTVTVRTHLTLPPGTRWLAVGACAARAVRLDGAELPVEGDGYQTFSPLPAATAPRTARLDLDLTALEDGPVRASFAVVRDRDAYRRPEWLTAGTHGSPGRVSDLTLTADLARPPADTVVHIGSDGACTVLVNGTEAGRQGDFHPYPDHREVRVHPYDIGPLLHPGRNTLTLRLTDTAATPTAATLDTAPRAAGGLGWISGPHWSATADGLPQPVRTRPSHLGRDPRAVCATARPHPLPGAAWLDPAAAPGDVVEPLVPDLAPGGPRTEWLRFTAPLGTTALRVPTALPCAVHTGGHTLTPDAGGRVALPGPLPAGATVTLCLTADGGRRGGALLEGPVEAETAETTAPLTDWESLGLRALGGEVRHRTTLALPAVPTGRTLLDLGEVRGAVAVTVGGAPAGERAWGPWAFDVTGLLRPGENEVEVVVRGTLAGYLDDASPTRAIAGGQIRTGLFGPVRLVVREESAGEWATGEGGAGE
ncbi:hypothetical protein [Streptomyces sp. NPDC050560]|uniref:hypothetical protein n=1 Tax=Streptomyces sp. NPDC050560 TaxID=3365630 RepID=UPI0037ACA10D